MTSRHLAILSSGLVAAWTSAFADTVDVREWLVPWPESAPSSPVVGPRGRTWFVGANGDYVANLSPDSSEFNRYDLRKGTEPVDLLVDEAGNLWVAGHRRRSIGRLVPSTGRVTEFEMPGRKARDLRSMAFDRDGNIWFTAEGSDTVGRLRVDSGEVDLVELPGRRARPYGIAIDGHGKPWVTAPGSASLIAIDPQQLTATAIPLPAGDSEPYRIAVTSDDLVWYTDAASGTLGRYNPAIGEFVEWTMPGGRESRPLAMVADRYDRLWIVETGIQPNRIVGFDTRMTTFLTVTEIPSGAGSVSRLYYHEPLGQVWFGTATNYVGRAVVH